MALASVVTGAVVKGPVDGATVCAYELMPTGKGTSLGCAVTQADGSYALSLEYSGAVVIEATGGRYTDEATGTPGVSLAAPLTVAASVAAGTQALYLTPLTTLALNSASSGGSLTLARFDSVATQVATAFKLPGSINLASSRPVVQAGQRNAYGEALAGISTMMGRGATLPGIVGNVSLTGLASAYEAVADPTCQKQASSDLPSGSITTTPVADAGPMELTVNQPFSSWRALLPPAGGTFMGCEVVANTVASVGLVCGAGSVTQVHLITNPTVWGVKSTEQASGLVLAGSTISGKVPTAVATTLDATGSICLGHAMLDASGNLIPTGPTTVGAGTSTGTSGGVLTGGAPLMGQPPIVGGTITLGNGTTGGGTINTAGGLAVLPGITTGGAIIPVGGLTATGGITSTRSLAPIAGVTPIVR